MNSIIKQNHKISVIAPIYKAEFYLDRCIKSIVNQTYKNLEIILVDDDSPDRCPQICDEWQKKDERIIVIHKQSGGVAAARNTGLDKATGGFISFVDSDDFITDDFLETLYNICNEYECDIAQCGYTEVFNDSIVSCAKENSIKIFGNIQMLYNIYSELDISTIVLWNKLYKKHLFENIRYPAGKIHEDEAVSYKVIYNANKIAVTSKRLYMYYQSDNSVIRGKYNSKRLDIFDALEERIRFFNERNLNELRDKATLAYCYGIIEAYNKCKKHIPNYQDALKELMDKHKRMYKKVLFQKNTSVFVKIALASFRFEPRLYTCAAKVCEIKSKIF